MKDPMYNRRVWSNKGFLRRKPKTHDEWLKHIQNDLDFFKQARDFDPANPTKYDLVISMGYTLLTRNKKRCK